MGKHQTWIGYASMLQIPLAVMSVLRVLDRQVMVA